MLFVAVLETTTLRGLSLPPLRINPARGVDLPDLDLGIKSPSENYCTSEPFFSAYERLLGSDFDIIVLLTDYQTAKRSPPLRLQIIKWRYLEKTQVADRSLCRIAKLHREWLLQESESSLKKLFRFLAYVNQSDWRAKFLLRLVEVMRDETAVHALIQEARSDFAKKNSVALTTDRPLLSDDDLISLERIAKLSPSHFAVIDAADNWVIDVLRDAARAPSENEWQRLRSGPLDGQIGMSFALQWRYNFGHLFGVDACEVPPELP